MSNESENEKKNAALYEQIKKENREKLTTAIDLLRAHLMMVDSIVIAESIGRFDQVLPARELTRDEQKPLRDAMVLLTEIRTYLAIAEDVKAGHVVLGVNAPYTAP
tara:strand:+ start:205 stop:522 length:318 start_codon:yes stop_codon:yes gene_type:complete